VTEATAEPTRLWQPGSLWEHKAARRTKEIWKLTVAMLPIQPCATLHNHLCHELPAIPMCSQSRSSGLTRNQPNMLSISPPSTRASRLGTHRSDILVAHVTLHLITSAAECMITARCCGRVQRPPQKFLTRNPSVQKPAHRRSNAHGPNPLAAVSVIHLPAQTVETRGRCVGGGKARRWGPSPRAQAVMQWLFGR